MKEMDYEVKQIRDGVQPRPYADHVWEWDIITDKPYDEVLEYCRKNLKSAEREEKDYWVRRRDNSHTFDEDMDVICGGFYKLAKTENGYNYKVVNEYID